MENIRDDPPGFVFILLIIFLFLSSIYDSVKFHFCEKKTVEVSVCCGEWDYGPGGAYCIDITEDCADVEVCAD